MHSDDVKVRNPLRHGSHQALKRHLDALEKRLGEEADRRILEILFTRWKEETPQTGAVLTAVRQAYHVCTEALPRTGDEIELILPVGSASCSLQFKPESVPASLEAVLEDGIMRALSGTEVLQRQDLNGGFLHLLKPAEDRFQYSKGVALALASDEGKLDLGRLQGQLPSSFSGRYVLCFVDGNTCAAYDLEGKSIDEADFTPQTIESITISAGQAAVMGGTPPPAAAASPLHTIPTVVPPPALAVAELALPSPSVVRAPVACKGSLFEDIGKLVEAATRDGSAIYATMRPPVLEYWVNSSPINELRLFLARCQLVREVQEGHKISVPLMTGGKRRTEFGVGAVPVGKRVEIEILGDVMLIKSEDNALVTMHHLGGLCQATSELAGESLQGYGVYDVGEVTRQVAGPEGICYSLPEERHLPRGERVGVLIELNGKKSEVRYVARKGNLLDVLAIGSVLGRYEILETLRVTGEPGSLRVEAA